MTSALAAIPMESDVFTSIAGLPLHPLVVHFAVVLLPLAALALVAIIVVPRWRGAFGWVTMAGLVIGFGASFIAKQSGEALAEVVGNPKQHADLGNTLPFVAFGLLVAGALWFWLARRDRAGGERRTGPLTRFVGVVAVVMAGVTVVLTVLVGHTGAQAVWESRWAQLTNPAPSAAGATPAPDGQGPASPSAAPSASGYTVAEVAKHNSPSDCWAIVKGSVYDLTSWIDQHPGGPQVIERMCGGDGTAAFENQHGGQKRPANELDNFLLGPLQQ